MEKPERIYLVGMPASGKTTFGKALAKALNFEFIDLDEVLVEKAGTSISNLFREKGEAYFRDLEKEILENTIPARTVIATGGGAPCFFENMDFILKNGFSIFLYVPVKELARRSMQQHGSRPLLNDFKEKALEEELEKKLKLRLPFYEKANLKLSGKEISHEFVISKLNQQ
ncbi:shikimate kinase [Flexithrix dorotheae]|uniref:shikimate kinase n=1 Tax=Flexithrix dorotheae TaxID=70993 RepID=UPI00037F07AF|nr:shikimate kinase [Flexithrix dorotheae]